ncbi:hypothetical protein [Ammoniphilus resinae]|uniref:Uncharacterized protein n=1 Tax=Ammoniphilus resinae TaxID=861532 RepID=A0ABS4GY42_9BACL|nr:hypothetical protein [Ammoniphilus resinae]MBP1935022.1 hypothetical protein [Ammoniphilus resinae]
MDNITEAYRQDFLDMKAKFEITEELLHVILGYFESDLEKQKMKEYLSDQLDLQNKRHVDIYYKIMDRLY